MTKAQLWPTWLKRENGPARPVRYHILIEYVDETPASVVAFCPSAVRFERRCNDWSRKRYLAVVSPSGKDEQVSPYQILEKGQILSYRNRRARMKRLTDVSEAKENSKAYRVEVYNLCLPFKETA
ncbi:hypothetical protein EVAR_37390_1 [Eumeta japonica]|uniref:Uncharacterized protein n=1 Tax=Eumeta variegata TaxID=151549 RepID=A0A4C1ZQW6_EUMVA|nr:hypothetical protein EVAR_37390_1 [Eumeta japonica]